ncbi:hypothetical protein MKW94_001916 [Papaver nudicaule]|uniref:RRM domain-containing protein n=1 Tax=Papaver nudicaule TaxID=74823 RepID=A0AA41RXI8_PAPNU|nr:hypothetical protein [Papaver nudicaule]
MGRGGGRDRLRKDPYSRSTEKSQYGKSHKINPPSRRLWVGNLSHHVTETELSEQFLRFGEVESIAFQPGRSYAFLNFAKEEDALIAVRALQGFVLAGCPLKIEFAKAERSSREEETPSRRLQKSSAEQESSFSWKDSRTHHSSPDPYFLDNNSRMGDKNAKPSEVLWIGFPASLNVDETILRRTFSPFGEIFKITVFPGRSYAFVQFTTVAAAHIAKETLQGNLFNNPRVNICFAKSEVSPSEHSRDSVSQPFSPHSSYWQDHLHGNPTGPGHRGSPHITSHFEAADSGFIGFNRNNTLQNGGSRDYEHNRSHEPGSRFGFSETMYKRYRSSPASERFHLMNSSPKTFVPFEDPAYLQDDAYIFREPKKLKMGLYPFDENLPGHPLSGPPRAFMDFPEHEGYEETGDHRRTPYESFPAHSGSLPVNPVKRQTLNPESRQRPLNDVWKWEGTIAKGGTPVCRARCFPVGKVLDFMLPEFLDCSARTGLDMLAKHFYQAASSWVVFFVPDDADIAFYNEFLHYLGENQRAAVAKLGEKTTLFLVPPSDFSEKVLKVPGKVSISGVILKFHAPDSDSRSTHNPLEATDSKVPSFLENLSNMKTESPDLRYRSHCQSESYMNTFSEGFPVFPSLPTSKQPENKDTPYAGNVPGLDSSTSYSGSVRLSGRASESLNENGYYNRYQPQNPGSRPIILDMNTGTGNASPHLPDSALRYSNDPITQDFHPSSKPVVTQETALNQYTPANLSSSSNFSYPERALNQVSSTPSLQPEQFAQLASLLGQRQHTNSGSALSLQEDRKNSGVIDQQGISLESSETSISPNQGSASDTFASQFTQEDHQRLQMANAVTVSQTNPQKEAPEWHGNPSQSNTVGAAEEESGQKRLQATLQLAASLLQQLQQKPKGPLPT